MSTVYVTQEVPTADYRAAEKFGNVVFLCTSEISSSPSSLHNVKMVNLIRQRMKNYDPDMDFIAPSGSPIIACLVMAIAAEKGKTYNFLKWNNRDYSYTPIRVGIEESGDVI